mgnify:CR=1 FL=1|jgi:hypothetical protein|tara:strand:- start:86 stop:268 length:183 start_codon:yes stop_codon:yes gene_type:complete
MTVSYKLCKDIMTGEVCSVNKTYEGSNKMVGIPLDEENCDYQEYLAWLKEGNEPLPADSE